MNHSPWIEQLTMKRPARSLTQPIQSDVVVVGAGIAGLSTSFFSLRDTNKTVILVEANRVAHGATGHNAGQIVSYFERQFSELVTSYGLEASAAAQRSIDSGWRLIDEIYAETKLTTPLYSFTGFAGCQDRAEVLVHLENIWFCQQANLTIEPLTLASDVLELRDIPSKYDGLYNRLPQQEILKRLETNDTRFIAVLSARKGCMNSALFCEDLLGYLLERYPDRFQLFENTPVQEVVLESDYVMLNIHHQPNNKIYARRVVLCTNGFERFKITNHAGSDIDAKFHHLVNGRVGYMAAYVSDESREPVAISYLNTREVVASNGDAGEPYFYLTRRPYEGAGNEGKNLICVGGPESVMDDSNDYHQEHPYPAEAQEMIDAFLHRTYKHSPQGEIHYKYAWHGLMGYTPNGLRCIGPEPLNPLLLYNLGCNGVGILPSIYGGRKIAQFLNGESLPYSIFDPQGTPTSPRPLARQQVEKLLRGIA